MARLIAIVLLGLALVLPTTGTGRRSQSSYAPVTIDCPAEALIRPADGLSPEESAYVEKRSEKTSESLRRWLSDIDSTFANVTRLPRLAMAYSGGGYRSFLLSAGVTQALDGRENIGGQMAGLLQAFTYQAGISGGSWLISSMIGNDWPTVSSLQQELWTMALERPIFNVPLNPQKRYLIEQAIVAKSEAGWFNIGMTDTWGLLLGFQLFKGADGGVAKTLSGIADSSSFSNFDVPFPILLSNGVEAIDGDCGPRNNATIYEFSPYEFGSWGPDVAAFTPMKTLGSPIKNGTVFECVSSFDNLGYALGASSSLFHLAHKGLRLGNACNPYITPSGVRVTEYTGLEAITRVIENIHHAVFEDDPEYFANIPNPFFKYDESSRLYNAPHISLVDGGSAITYEQNSPINPFLQPSRGVDVLFVNDNSANVDNLPDGSSLFNTYVSAKAENLNLERMPTIPTPEFMVSFGLHKRPTAFGCEDPNKITIIWLPHVGYNPANNRDALKVQWSEDDSEVMIRNGNAIVTRDRDESWPMCAACIVMRKTDTALPEECELCFAGYCFN